MIARSLRMWRTIRHVTPAQLLHRLRLTALRRWRVRYAERYRQRLLAEPLPALRVRHPLPAPIMPPRDTLATVDGRAYRLTFLNEPRSFAHPFDWHPPDLAYGTRLWLLNLHYMEFLEALPDDAFVAVVDDWIAHVPPYRPGYWMDDWNSYALSIRCVVWMQEAARRWAGLPAGFVERMLASLVRQLRFLARNLEVDIGGNHLIKNIKALLWGGRFFAIEEAEGWHTLGRRLLRQELHTQILLDGMHYERSPAYHMQVFADLVECDAVLEDGPDRDRLRAVLRPMAQVVADLTHPDGCTSLFNDGGLHMAYAPANCLQAWEQATGERVTPRSVFALQEAGYAGLRQDDAYVLVDCGAVAPDHLTAHGQGDILSFEWTLGGHRMVVDAGVFEYNAGPRRDYARSTRAHNTVTLDGQDQCEFWGAFRMGHRARVTRTRYEARADGFALTGRHDGFRRMAGAPIVERSFDVAPGRIQVIDRILGGAGQQAEARLLLHPDCRVFAAGDAFHIARDGVQVRLETTAQVAVGEAEWYPDFGVAERCTQLTLCYGAAPCTGGFHLLRIPAGRPSSTPLSPPAA